MSASFIVYIDESGDEGFQFTAGSSEWFVLSAVVIRSSNDQKMIEAVALVRETFEKRKDYALHFRKLRHEQRIHYVKALAELPIRTVTVLAYKPALVEPETFRDYRLYRYCVRFLLERVSWLCRDQRHKGPGDGSADVIFSNRSAMSYVDLREYIVKLLSIGAGNPLEVRIEPSVIVPNQIRARQHQQLAGLQAADAVASSFYLAAQTHRLGFTEPRYVEELSRTVYTHLREGMGYGVKFWPKECDQKLRDEEALAWALRLFAKK